MKVFKKVLNDQNENLKKRQPSNTISPANNVKFSLIRNNILENDKIRKVSFLSENLNDNQSK